MTLAKLYARIPLWAFEAGLAAPKSGESFVDYARRIGLNPDDLLTELTDKTAELAYYRLECTLSRHLPHAWDAYLAKRCGKECV